MAQRARADALATVAERLAVLRAEMDGLLAANGGPRAAELDGHVREVEALFDRLRELLHGGQA